jgi:hypothetical protein
MSKVKYLIKPNKSGKFDNSEFRLLTEDFFKKFEDLSQEPRNSTLDLVVSCMYKNEYHGRHKATNKPQYHLSFTDYDSPNGDIDYVMVDDDTEIDEPEEVIYLGDIEFFASLIKSYAVTESFSVLVY